MALLEMNREAKSYFHDLQVWDQSKGLIDLPAITTPRAGMLRRSNYISLSGKGDSRQLSIGSVGLITSDEGWNKMKSLPEIFSTELTKKVTCLRSKNFRTI